MFVRAPMSPKAYIELTDAIAAAIAGPKVDVQLGPAGVQWCSKPLLEAVAENSAQTGRRIHMHLLETDLSARLGGSAFSRKVSSAISMTSASCRSG